MALDWANERWVRLYTRETPDQAAWGWQARALWPWLLARVDGAGVIETRGAKGLAAIVRLPLELVEAGIAELLEDGCAVATPRGYVIRNFIEAQTTKSSTNRRQAAVRELDRALAAITAAAASMTAAANVTTATEESHAVTAGHTESRDVTPSRAEPSREPDLSLGSPAGAHDPRAPAPVFVGTEPEARAASPDAIDEPTTTGALPMTRGPSLVGHAIERLNAARRELDPAADLLDAITDPRNARALWDHLQRLPADQRATRLDRAIDVMLETGRTEGKPLDFYRMAMLAGENAWPRWLSGSVESMRRAAERTSARGRDGGPGGPRSPSTARSPFAVAAELARQAREQEQDHDREDP